MCRFSSQILIKMANCKNCMRFQTCKFVEKNKEFAKQMYPMFEYLEWNNLEEVFFKNAGSCKFFVDNEMKVDNLLKKIETAKYQMKWINDYVRNPNGRLEASFIVEKLLKITEDYKTALDK
jgi:hypothetical protein